MLTKSELKQKACQTIDGKKKELIDVAQDILAHPETGFNETRTASLVSRKFDEMGIKHRPGLAITGVKGGIDCGGPGPSVALLGELDSLTVEQHPHANPETGAAPVSYTHLTLPTKRIV